MMIQPTEQTGAPRAVSEIAAVPCRVQEQLQVEHNFRLNTGKFAHNLFAPAPRNATSVPASMTPAAIAAEVHPVRKDSVGTSGLGGRLYIFGSPLTMKTA